MPSAPDFRLYHSNSLEVLAGLLADELRAPAPGQPLLAPDTILIPQVAMRRWLQATMAERHGIAANLEFLPPAQFVARVLADNAPAANPATGGKAGAGELDAASLRWRLYAALRDPAMRARPAMRQLAAWLEGDDPLKPWSLAGELATVFEKYQAWRRDWLLRWEAGADPDDPQAILWRAVAAGRDHRARRIQDYLARFGGDGPDLPSGLPPRLFVFATLNMSPDLLRVIATQARAGTLHFYLPTPTKEYWGDLQSLGARLRAGEDPFADERAENPLLRDWGAAGRDFMALLGSYEVVHPSGEIAAYADPEAASGAALANGGLRDSLLHRMQGDLFHRRASPFDALRTGVDANDPSLQFHACHTRLRELQVLHDRLRALLEDERFDPPLQPREIAVLAPDIDPYVPYLDAVFGGRGRGDTGFKQAIPWAIADASPLAGEPLAAVFLRLLALPVSRFGLEEILDLLASPPLADAAGLDGAAFERLHAWLHEAGARWGIDAAHRARFGAPEDDAYTWQFALDRLLLGHATDADALVEGAQGEGVAPRVAPWTGLEGSALDALDVLLRLLRVLARHQRLFGEAMPPAEWRGRLLDLLEAVPPRPRIGGNDERAYERLCKLIDAFAQEAEQAGFAAPVPGDVVRAHFASVLGEADTRAPLLTGGVSFARMVPMRLLPFRAICLLGMNDGDFPRRDPANGLNRLTAELGTGRRRHGDRSTRDDDRYLFLQLFSSAQDVFHVSWIGADPRDGSAREPSAVVSELLAAAAAYHDPAEPDALVLRHALQPFSPAAFGTGDARHFSYDARWHPGAGRMAGTRTQLGPWMPPDAPLPPPAEPETELALEDLRRFLLSPVDRFLRQRMGLRLPEVERAGEDIEPLRAPGGGLERNRLQHAVFEALLAGERRDAMLERLRARALLPSGALGARALSDLLEEVGPYADLFARWRGNATPADALSLEAGIDGVRLHGRLGGAWPMGLARVRFGEPNGPSVIRHGLDWLLASAAGQALPMFEFHDDGDGRFGPHERPAIDPAQAKEALRKLLELRAAGLREPLVFAPRSGWLYYSAKTPERGIEAARKQWQGGDRSWGEGAGVAYALALRARDPFADRAALREFVANATTVFSAVASGIGVAPQVDEDAIAAATLAGDEDE